MGRGAYRPSLHSQKRFEDSFSKLLENRKALTYLNKGKIARIHERGMRVNVYTVNSDAEMERFAQWGVDGIITNHPDRLMAILQNRGRSLSSGG